MRIDTLWLRNNRPELVRVLEGGYFFLLSHITVRITIMILQTVPMTELINSITFIGISSLRTKYE